MQGTIACGSRCCPVVPRLAQAIEGAVGRESYGALSGENLDEVPSSVLEDGGRHQPHLPRLLDEAHSEGTQSLGFRADIGDLERPFLVIDEYLGEVNPQGAASE